MNTLRAFHGSSKIKKKYLARVRAHRAADEIIHGTYWENGKGCGIGCTIHGSDHSRYELLAEAPVVSDHDRFIRDAVANSAALNEGV